MKVTTRLAFVVGACAGLWLSNSRKFAKAMSDLAEDVQEKVSAATIIKMIDVLLGEVVHTTLVSTQRVTDFLLDLRSTASQIETNTEN